MKKSEYNFIQKSHLQKIRTQTRCVHLYTRIVIKWDTQECTENMSALNSKGNENKNASTMKSQMNSVITIRKKNARVDSYKSIARTNINLDRYRRETKLVPLIHSLHMSRLIPSIESTGARLWRHHFYLFILFFFYFTIALFPYRPCAIWSSRRLKTERQSGLGLL